MKTKLTTIIIAGSIALLGASNTMAAEAKENFASKCAACHGKTGKGDTAMGKKLEIRDLSDAKVQAAITDDAIVKSIKEGVKKDGKQVMKGFADKLSEDEVKAMVAYIRSLKS